MSWYLKAKSLKSSGQPRWHVYIQVSKVVVGVEAELEPHARRKQHSGSKGSRAFTVFTRLRQDPYVCLELREVYRWKSTPHKQTAPTQHLTSLLECRMEMNKDQGPGEVGGDVVHEHTRLDVVA